MNSILRRARIPKDRHNLRQETTGGRQPNQRQKDTNDRMVKPDDSVISTQYLDETYGHNQKEKGDGGTSGRPDHAKGRGSR